MDPGPFRIAIRDGEITAIAYPASSSSSSSSSSRSQPTFLFAHGAGAGQRHPYVVGTAERLRARGVSVVTFDFPYTESGRKLPDKTDVLEACVVSAFDAVRAKVEPRSALFAGGKSMGGRIASQVAAKGAIDPAGLVFLGYPLHAPAKPSPRDWRDKHLPKVLAPMLFVQGTRDVFGTPADLEPLLAKCSKGSVVFAVEGGDHSHAVPKRAGFPQEQALAAIADEIAGWIAECLERQSHTVSTGR